MVDQTKMIINPIDFQIWDSFVFSDGLRQKPNNPNKAETLAKKYFSHFIFHRRT